MPYEVYETETFSRLYESMETMERRWIDKIKLQLKENPYDGKPLGYEFFREKKFDGKRLIFLVYESHTAIFLITITDKKMQQKVIDIIKSNLDVYKEELEKILKGI